MRSRIILNTLATYFRSILSACLGIFSNRWILGALGQTDYGLFSVIGVVVLFIVFINGILAASAARHFAFAEGTGDSDELSRWFNTSLSIHLILPCVLVAIGWPIGEYCIRHVLTIPADRVVTCLWIFRLSVLMAFSAMVSIPYTAMFTAKQRIAELAFWGSMQSFLAFGFAYVLTKLPGDRLLYYGIYGALLTFVFQVIQVGRALYLFEECRCNISWWFDRQRFRELFSFCVWSWVGSLGGMVRIQGPAVLLNLYFGAKVNAAYGIANQVASQSVTISNAMFNALSPEITAYEGRKDRERTLSLSLSACKFGTLLMLFPAIPLVVNMDYVLRLWLHNPPEYATIFCQCILAQLVVDLMTTGHMLAVNASGKIAGYQITLGIVNILSIPLAWVFIKRGFSPPSVGGALLISYTLCSFGRVLWARYLLQMPISKWFFEVFVSCGITMLTASVAAVGVHWLLPSSFGSLLASTAASVGIVGVLSWVMVLNVLEKERIAGYVSLIMKKVKGLEASPLKLKAEQLK